MANTQVQLFRRLLTTKQLIIAVVIVFLVETAVFTFFYATNQNPVGLVLPKLEVSGSPVTPTVLFGIYGSGPVGNLQRPMAVTVYDRKVFVSDTGLRKIAVFDYDGKPLYSFGQIGSEKGQFQFPYGITVDNKGLLYVADLNNKKISVFSQDGNFIKYFAEEGNFQGPAGLFFFDGKIFVTDLVANKVIAFDTDGNKVLEFGQPGTGQGELQYPNCITVTKDFIFVSDSGNNRVEKFDSTGKWLASNNSDQPVGQPSAFANNRGIGVDSKGTLFVVSNITNKLWGFDQDGHKAFEPIGDKGQANNQFNLPNGLFIDARGRIYIADSLNQRIMVYQN